jgi:two-component system KDP operon response regulator KdpE
MKLLNVHLLFLHYNGILSILQFRCSMGDLQSKKILVVDDDPIVRHLVQKLLQDEGCTVFVASDGHEGLRQFYAVRPDLVVLDINMPRMNGWETLKSIRQLTDTPVLMLTAQNYDDDVVKGLDLGADDYLAKPLNPKILLARMRVALRHAAQSYTGGQNAGYEDSYLTINIKEHQVIVKGESVKLSAKEFGMLAYLVENAGRLMTARQVLEHVWGWEYQDSLDYVRVYMTHLRQKLEADPKNPKYLITEHGTGYRFSKY